MAKREYKFIRFECEECGDETSAMFSLNNNKLIKRWYVSLEDRGWDLTPNKEVCPNCMTDEVAFYG